LQNVVKTNNLRPNNFLGGPQKGYELSGFSGKKESVLKMLATGVLLRLPRGGVLEGPGGGRRGKNKGEGKTGVRRIPARENEEPTGSWVTTSKKTRGKKKT